MNDLYLTCTFTNPWNVEFGPKIGAALEKAGLICYLPYRDTDQKGTPKDIFISDIHGIDDSKCILAIGVNESPNWGAEIGYAFGVRKPVIALTDKDHSIPLICNGMVTDTVLVKSMDEPSRYIDELLSALRKYI